MYTAKFAGLQEGHKTQATYGVHVEACLAQAQACDDCWTGTIIGCLEARRQTSATEKTYSKHKALCSFIDVSACNMAPSMARIADLPE